MTGKSGEILLFIATLQLTEIIIYFNEVQTQRRRVGSYVYVQRCQLLSRYQALTAYKYLDYAANTGRTIASGITGRINP